MFLVNEDAHLRCKHINGRVKVMHSQSWVTIAGRSVLVQSDPEGRTISGCPNVGPTIKPCTHTLLVKKGYSDLLRIDHHRVCLDSMIGLTDGTPPGVVEYEVHDPGQRFVSEKS